SVDEVEFSNVYLAFAQAPAPGIELVTSTAIPAADAVEPLRRAARRAGPGLPVASLTLGTERVRSSLQGARFNLWLIVVYAALALVVAGVGVYGSMACAVEERMREFGVRIALGALPRAILGEALHESVRVGLAGAIVGTCVVVTIARMLGSALYL